MLCFFLLLLLIIIISTIASPLITIHSIIATIGAWSPLFPSPPPFPSLDALLSMLYVYQLVSLNGKSPQEKSLYTS